MTDQETATDDCLFCRIIRREVPADVVLEDDHTLAFRDISPQAPVHVLVIPKVHHPDAAALAAAAPEALVALLEAVGAVADQEGLWEGYRTVFNTGARAHQTVFHAHAHVLGGRDMAWPPG
ncbi:histidine triad nucleotide-binding protein [Oryzihumus sp.]|jgi:histidine triad (HIT) family protein|uniref:histidine triad nucleotide-binding protein n=1 Tax=Oryzihumus sp. TaxID=1968903 RepID=UPI002EDBAC64